MNRWQRLRGWLQNPGSNLERRVAHGGVWQFAINILNRALQLVRTVVLARLLAPEDFGLFGITMLALSALQRFTQTGFDAALIQKPEDTVEYLDTAWMIQILRGLALGGVLVAGAPLVAAFFDEPGATSLVRVLALTVVIGGFQNIGVVYFRKNIEFHKQFVLQLSSTLPDLIASLIAALILRNAWALVAGLLAGRLVQALVSHLVHPYRPRLKFDMEQARELFDYGKFITAQSPVLFLLTEGDDAVLGKVLGTTSLGFYQMAYRLSNAAATEITHVVSNVTFPAYAKLQDQPERMNRGLLRTLALTMALALPMAGGLGVFAPELTDAVLGEQWMPMVPAMQVMCVFGAMRAISASFGPVYRAVARVDMEFKVSLTQLVILALIIYPMTVEGGLVGTSLAITVAMAVALVYNSILVSQVTGLGISELYSPVAPPALGVLAAGTQTYVLGSYVGEFSPVGQLVVLLPLAAVTYLIVVAAVYRAAGYTRADLTRLSRAMLRTEKT